MKSTGAPKLIGMVVGLVASLAIFKEGPLVFVSHADAVEQGSAAVREIWGNIKQYTDSYIIVNGNRYDYARHVIIDTYSLKKDPRDRGNVRVQLDAQGKAVEIYFYGIDMPDAFRLYKR